MDLFAARIAGGVPDWPDLPKDAREALVGLMTRLILEHARTLRAPRGDDVVETNCVDYVFGLPGTKPLPKKVDSKRCGATTSRNEDSWARLLG